MNHKSAATLLASKLETLFTPSDESIQESLVKNPRLLILETMNEAFHHCTWAD